MDDIASGFTTGAAAAADIVACTSGTCDFAAGTAITVDGARACTDVTAAGAAAAFSACCTVATADGCTSALLFLLST